MEENNIVKRLAKFCYDLATIVLDYFCYVSNTK